MNPITPILIFLALFLLTFVSPMQGFGQEANKSEITCGWGLLESAYSFTLSNSKTGEQLTTDRSKSNFTRTRFCLYQNFPQHIPSAQTPDSSESDYVLILRTNQDKQPDNLLATIHLTKTTFGPNYVAAINELRFILGKNSFCSGTRRASKKIL